jgi:hypothetical protein
MQRFSPGAVCLALLAVFGLADKANVAIVFPFQGALLSAQAGIGRPFVFEMSGQEPYLKCVALASSPVLYGVEGGMSLAPVDDIEEVCVERETLTGWQLHSDALGVECFVLKVRLVHPTDKTATLAEDTISFCAFPHVVKFANATVRKGAVDLIPNNVPLHVPKATVLATVDKSRYAHLIHNTPFRLHGKDYSASFRDDFQKPAGNEPYNLLAHLAQQLQGKLIVDLGTHYASSAFALGSAQSNTIWSYDLHSHEEMVADYNNMSTAELRQAAPNIMFRGGNALLVLGSLLPAPLISLDTAHFPDTIPFEREFILALKQAGYQGVVVCDDIFLNREMIDW